MDTVTAVLIYLATSIIFFTGMMIFNRKKLKSRRSKNRKIIIVKYAVFSLLYGILIPICIVGLSTGNIPIMSVSSLNSDIEDTEYGKSTQYDGDMIAIAVILLVFFAFVGAILLMSH